MAVWRAVPRERRTGPPGFDNENMRAFTFDPNPAGGGAIGNRETDAAVPRQTWNRIEPGERELNVLRLTELRARTTRKKNIANAFDLKTCLDRCNLLWRTSWMYVR